MCKPRIKLMRRHVEYHHERDCETTDAYQVKLGKSHNLIVIFRISSLYLLIVLLRKLLFQLIEYLFG